MFIQAFYGYVTNSLGLLSDTVHMFFDCVALLVGLVAAVASKWPRSQKFPYGLGKMESLSGFANGILLMCVPPLLHIRTKVPTNEEQIAASSASR